MRRAVFVVIVMHLAIRLSVLHATELPTTVRDSWTRWKKLEENGDFQQAMRIAPEVVKAGEQHLQGDPDRLALLYFRAGRLYGESGKYDEALRLLKKSAEISRARVPQAAAVLIDAEMWRGRF